jgi:hypothetical protein
MNHCAGGPHLMPTRRCPPCRSRTVGRAAGVARRRSDACVQGAHVQGGGLHAQGVAIVPASLLRRAPGYDRVRSDAEVELLATTAWTRLHPAA